jgi:hypothetical protein
MPVRWHKEHWIIPHPVKDVSEYPQLFTISAPFTAAHKDSPE